MKNIVITIDDSLGEHPAVAITVDDSDYNFLHTLHQINTVLTESEYDRLNSIVATASTPMIPMELHGLFNFYYE